MNDRIEFIDLAKGICIIMVICVHCDMNLSFPGLDSMRMPLYFILSGLFFKTYGGFKNFIVKKTNKILLPFIFFYLLGYVAFYAIKAVRPEMIQLTVAQGITDVFTGRQYFNGPIWFLLALYWTNIIFCIIHLYIKSEWIRVIIIGALSAIGVMLSHNGIELPFLLDVSITAIPFFYFGYLLKKSDILLPNKYDKYLPLYAVGFYAVAFIIDYFFDLRYYVHYNIIEGNFIIIILLSICSALSVILLCKWIKRVPIISYIGRYSIIALCIHNFINRPVEHILAHTPLASINEGGYFTALFTIAITIGCIPICIKFIPYFTAQKELIKS